MTEREWDGTRGPQGEKKLTPEVSPLEAITDALDVYQHGGMAGDPEKRLSVRREAAVALEALRDAGYVIAVARVQWRR